MKYGYVIDKIKETPTIDFPFKHVEINDLLSPSDFQELVNSPEVAMRPSANDRELFDNLFNTGYKIIPFPGCTEDYREYINWHKTKEISHKINTSCEGFGVVLRLMQTTSQPLRELVAFLNSHHFMSCIAEKFDVDLESCSYDAGIQKYLDGYEISPHPDIRRKALTYMVNINPNQESEHEDHHTHYLKFKSTRDYVRGFWSGNHGTDTCWVPWEWCDSKKQQTKNNSIVMFSPASDTLHGVKANYDHLIFQRTQMYGNLWYKDNPCDSSLRWEDLDISGNQKAPLSVRSMVDHLKRMVPSTVKSVLKNSIRKRTKETHGDRLY